MSRGRREEEETASRQGVARPSGDVVLALVVDEGGGVADARVVHSDDKLLEAPALRSVKKWRYLPATKDGVAGKMRLQVTVRFHL